MQPEDQDGHDHAERCSPSRCSAKTVNELYEQYYEPTPQRTAEPRPAGPRKPPWPIKPDLREPDGTEFPSRNCCDWQSGGSRVRVPSPHTFASTRCRNHNVFPVQGQYFIGIW